MKLQDLMKFSDEVSLDGIAGLPWENCCDCGRIKLRDTENYPISGADLMTLIHLALNKFENDQDDFVRIVST